VVEASFEVLGIRCLEELNRWIDKTYHPYFEDPDKCLQAVFLDAYAHQAIELILGLHLRR